MITIKDLKKDYKDFQLDVSFEIPEGRVSGLVGKNGAGKSTTIKSILGLIRPDSGEIEVFGKSPDQLTCADKEMIGVAMSDSGFSGYLDIEIVIKILKNMYHDFDEGKFRRLCKQQELPLDKKIKDFSTGMKAKLRVLSALSHKAKLLIMDEPTAGLDVEARNDILDLIREYLSENEDSSILISSHISSDLESLCDDVYLIHKGKILLHEDTDRLLSEYGVLKVSEEEFERLDQEHIISCRKENYGYLCFTDQKQYYMENYPQIIVENSGIDDMILMMAKGR